MQELWIFFLNITEDTIDIQSNWFLWSTQLQADCNNGIHTENYRNVPKFSDRYAWANSADPDQTAPTGAVWSGSSLFAIPSASFGLITLW